MEIDFEESSIDTIPVSTVQIDGLTVMKLIKHQQDSLPNVASGQLIGVDEKGTLIITNAFPVPLQKEEQEEDSAAVVYREQMVSSLRAMNYEEQLVGLYQSIPSHSSPLSMSLIEIQYEYQKEYSQAVHLIINSPRNGNDQISINAVRLTDSFIKFYESKNFTSKSINEFGMKFNDIFEFLPVVIQNSHLLQAAYSDIKFQTESFVEVQGAFHLESIGPDYVSEKYFEKQLEYLSEIVDVQSQENWRWHQWHRGYSKEYQKSLQYVARLHQENQKLISQKKKPIHAEKDLIPNSPLLQRVLQAEPSRLDSLLIASQMESYCNQINELSGPFTKKPLQ
jgi:translation initiation factor 3 subunit H